MNLEMTHRKKVINLLRYRNVFSIRWKTLFLSSFFMFIFWLAFYYHSAEVCGRKFQIG